MNLEKAAFFDVQADRQWACADYTPEEKAKIARWMRRIGIRAGMRIIEPGCGTGRFTEILADLVGPRGSLIACDISAGMIAKCRRRLDRRGNVRIHLAAMEDIPFEHKSYDMVLCHQVFPHFDDKVQAVRLLVSALKPEGRFVVSHFTSSAEINVVHHGVHPAVIDDLIPAPEEMTEIFASVGMVIETLEDDDEGYFLMARFAGLRRQRRNDRAGMRWPAMAEIRP